MQIMLKSSEAPLPYSILITRIMQMLFKDEWIQLLTAKL